MGAISNPQPVKLFCGVLTRFEHLFGVIKSTLEQAFGPVDAESDTWKFDYTTYYERTMGAGLLRKFFAFESLIPPDRIVESKIRTNQIEDEFARKHQLGVSRPINLDPGYISLSKLTLATTKDYSHRVYLRDGIYLEITLKYQNGQYLPWPWTYPDYRSADYQRFFLRVRELYVQQLRAFSTRYA